MATVSAAVSNLIEAFAAIGASLYNSILAVLLAFVALGEEVVSGVIHLVQAIVAFGTDLFGSVLGFVAAHFVALLVIAGGYYWYTHSQSGRRGAVKSR
ncbi:hypothetical protein WOLCODRAFT_62851 [Wolfiporia cocos MD-104 SS10]|uniref:Uncharacterized protein n=1 Tax=Wolfiporia cocos (strain MD-104) TaxID=742152 RepID=A0A2H3J9U2_WOLCO|nr:hypothetical protein WOLCODRAFT_62851 [Wolfiporia cocos MD-104 SS10]